MTTPRPKTSTISVAHWHKNLKRLSPKLLEQFLTRLKSSEIGTFGGHWELFIHPHQEPP